MHVEQTIHMYIAEVCIEISHIRIDIGTHTYLYTNTHKYFNNIMVFFIVRIPYHILYNKKSRAQYYLTSCVVVNFVHNCEFMLKLKQSCMVCVQYIQIGLRQLRSNSIEWECCLVHCFFCYYKKKEQQITFLQLYNQVSYLLPCCQYLPFYSFIFLFRVHSEFYLQNMEKLSLTL